MVHAAFRLLARSGARFACVAFQSSSARKYHPVLVGVLAAYLAYASRSRRGSILVRKWPPARDLEAALHLEECQYGRTVLKSKSLPSCPLHPCLPQLVSDMHIHIHICIRGQGQVQLTPWGGFPSSPMSFLLHLPAAPASAVFPHHNESLLHLPAAPAPAGHSNPPPSLHSKKGWLK